MSNSAQQQSTPSAGTQLFTPKPFTPSKASTPGYHGLYRPPATPQGSAKPEPPVSTGRCLFQVAKKNTEPKPDATPAVPKPDATPAVPKPEDKKPEPVAEPVKDIVDDEPKPAEPKKEVPAKEEATKDEPVKDELAKDEPVQEAPKVYTPKIKREVPREEVKADGAKITISLEKLLEIGESMPRASDENPLPENLAKFIRGLIRAPKGKGGAKGPKGKGRKERRERDHSKKAPRTPAKVVPYKSVFGDKPDNGEPGKKLTIDCKVIMNKMVKDNKEKIQQELIARITGKEGGVDKFERIPDGEVTEETDKAGNKETHYGKEVYYKQIIEDIFEMACRQPPFAPLYAETIVMLYHKDVFAHAITPPEGSAEGAPKSAADLVGSKRPVVPISPARVKRWTKRAIVELVQKEFQQMSELTEEEEQRLAACETDEERADFHAKRADHVRNNVLFIGELFVQSKAEIISKQVLFQSCFSSLMAHFKADDFVVEQLDTPKIECLVDLIKAVGPTLDQMRIADERDSHTLTQLKKEGEKLNALTRKADEEALKNQDSKGKRRSEGASDELKRQLKVVSERFFHGKECNARQVAEKVAKYSAVVRNNAEREKKWQDMWVDMQTLVDTCKEWEKEAHRPVRARYLIQDLFTIRDGNWAALQATKALSKQEAKQERESIQRDRLSQARSRSRASARSSLSRASTRTATADTGMWTPSRSHSKGSNRTTPATQSSVNARRGLGPKASLFGALMDSQEDLYADLNATIDDGAVGWLNESTSLDDIMGYVEHTVDEAELEDFDAAMVHAHNRMVRAVLDQVGRTKEGKLTVFFRYVREMISLKHVEAGDDDLCEHVAKALAKLVEAGSVKNQEIAQALAEFAYRTLKLKATIFIELIRANTPNALAFIAGVLAKTVVDEEDEDEVNLEDTANWLTAVNLREFTHVNEAQLAETIDAKAPGLFAQISASRLASAIARGDKNLGDLPTANPARSQTAMAALFTIKRRKMAPNPTPAEALKKLKALCGEVDLTAAEVARVHQEFQTPDTAIEDTFAEYIAVGGDVQAVKEWATGMMSRPLPRFKAQGKAVMEMVEKQ